PWLPDGPPPGPRPPRPVTRSGCRSSPESCPPPCCAFGFGGSSGEALAIESAAVAVKLAARTNAFHHRGRFGPDFIALSLFLRAPFAPDECDGIDRRGWFSARAPAAPLERATELSQSAPVRGTFYRRARPLRQPFAATGSPAARIRPLDTRRHGGIP